MENNNKSKIISDTLKMYEYLFNPKKALKKDFTIQFIFNEPEGQFNYFLEIKNKNVVLKNGLAQTPIYKIITELETFEKIGGGYITGKDAMKSGRFKIKGSFFKFITLHKKIFSGKKEWYYPQYENIYKNDSDEIKKVLVLSSSPRCEKGVTHFMVEKLVDGMKKAGADIEIVFPSKMKINPCIGCFTCFATGEKKCIYHEKDDMNDFINKFENCDLIVWATPIYFHYCSTHMKILMDRLFVGTVPNFEFKNNKIIHPTQMKWPKYQLLLAGTGFPNFKEFDQIFGCLKLIEGSGKQMKLIVALRRITSNLLISDSFRNIKKDNIITSLTKAGEEIIKYKKVNKKTKEIFEQKLFSDEYFMCLGNRSMDKVIKEKKIEFVRAI